MKKKTNHKHIRPIRKIQILGICILILSILLLWSYTLSSTPMYSVQRITEKGTIEHIESFHKLKDAKKRMLQESNAKQKKNARILDKHKEVIAIGYGIVNFRTKECSVNTSYMLDSTKTSGYINGCYGADGAYLDTSEDGTKIKFKQAGAIGWVDKKDVTIKNYTHGHEISSINHYTTKDKKTVHHITTNVESETYRSPLEIGVIDLSDNVYYSYDGHYFYASFPTMIDDYRKGTYKNSINKEPYYNFYQYLSHRSKSAYTAQDIDRYIEQHLKLTKLEKEKTKQSSLLYKSGNAFETAQNTYGTNAIMMLSLSINESNYGRSKIALEKHNLFGHAAYDSSPGESAASYNNVAESIQSHALYYLQKRYLNPDDKRFFGGFFGDKASGMNVRYASDPYWGEKAAWHYRLFDRVMGAKDQRAFTVRILNQPVIPIYQRPDKNSTILYTLKNIQPYAYTLVDTTSASNWFSMQSDVALQSGTVRTQSDFYSFSQSIAYIFDE